MEKKVFEAVITYEIEEGHPDIQYVKNVNDELQFNDTYTMDCDRFYCEDEMIDYIKHDLSIVAGGGYSNEHIKNVKFDIRKIG